MNFSKLPRWAVICFYLAGAALAAILLLQHWVHIPSFLPFAFLLACPLIHLFGHHRHGRRRHVIDRRQDSTAAPP